jgi:competence protein ComEA
VDDPTDDDGRAARALEELRRSRGVSDPGIGEGRPSGPIRAWTQTLRPLGELGAPEAPRLVLYGAAALVAVLLGLGTWFLVNGRGATGGAASSPFAASAVTDTSAVTTPPAGATSSTTTGEIVVHAAGAVARPGLQRLAPGARVADVLEAAGGPAPDADLDRLNLAAPVADGQRLFVPRIGEVAPATVAPDGGGAISSGGGATDEPAASGPIDLNTATAEELDALPGVGPATAAAIIDHRESNGRFASVDDLLDVRGIGPAKLEGLRDLVVAG